MLLPHLLTLYSLNLPLSPSITPSLFHSRLKTYFFTNLSHHRLPRENFACGSESVVRSSVLNIKIDTSIPKFQNSKISLRFQFQHLQCSQLKAQVTRNSWDETANANFFMTSSTTFTQCAPEDPEFGEIMQNKGHYAVQGHSRSLILVPIESSYTTSY